MTKRGFTITRETTFKDARRVGLDSGMLISLIDNMNLFAEYALKIFNEKGLLFTHEICVEEAITVLTRDYGWKKDGAQKSVENFLNGMVFSFYHGIDKMLIQFVGCFENARRLK